LPAGELGLGFLGSFEAERPPALSSALFVSAFVLGAMPLSPSSMRFEYGHGNFERRFEWRLSLNERRRREPRLTPPPVCVLRRRAFYGSAWNHFTDDAMSKQIRGRPRRGTGAQASPARFIRRAIGPCEPPYMAFVRHLVVLTRERLEVLRRGRAAVGMAIRARRQRLQASASICAACLGSIVRCFGGNPRLLTPRLPSTVGSGVDAIQLPLRTSMPSPRMFMDFTIAAAALRTP
jgi:hypothetical protein